LPRNKHISSRETGIDKDFCKKKSEQKDDDISDPRQMITLN
jgi:hypothetical protein